MIKTELNNNMEESMSNMSVQDNECYTTKSNSFYTSTIINNKLYSKDKSESISMDQMNKCFKGLTIQSYLKHNKEKSEHLAGKIDNIIEKLYTVIVKPYSTNMLLYIGTPLFLIYTSFQNNTSKYTLLGYIDDIFGSVGEPMYSVTIKCNPTNALNINANVYYLFNHPNTLHIYVEHSVDKTSNKKKNNITAKNL